MTPLEYLEVTLITRPNLCEVITGLLSNLPLTKTALSFQWEMHIWRGGKTAKRHDAGGQGAGEGTHGYSLHLFI